MPDPAARQRTMAILNQTLRLPFRGAALSAALYLAATGSLAAFGFPGSGMSGPGMGIPGFSGPFSGMPGGFPGSSGMPGGFPGSSGMGSWPDTNGNWSGFSRMFPDFSFNRRDFRRNSGPWQGDLRRRRPYQYLPDWLGRRVRPGAGAIIYDMAFVQDRSFRRMRMIVVQTSTRNGMLAQRCMQYSVAPVMNCQAHLNGNVSRSYMMQAPATSPLDNTTPLSGNSMSFSSKGRWRDMTVYGKFRYIAGRTF